MKKLLFCLGTRPEALKMAPIIRKWENKVVINTGQHLDIIDLLDIPVDINFEFMNSELGLFNIISNTKLLANKIREISPDYVVVQGDTSTAYIAALAAYYLGVKIIHVEAGLRTYKKNPFPEEFNRRSIDLMSDIMFAPTENNVDNLLDEQVNGKIFLTGNTIVDELERMIKVYDIKNVYNGDIVLITIHRRESKNYLLHIIEQLNQITEDYPQYRYVYPVHPNNKDIIKQYINKKIKFVDPLPYLDFISLMSKSYCIISDSGGIQEEAPNLGKPVLVVRNETERSELIQNEGGYLTGYNNIKYYFDRINILKKIENPFGDGKASDRIINIIEEMC